MLSHSIWLDRWLILPLMNLSPETVSTRLLFHPLNFRLLEGDSATTLKSSLRDTESSKLSLSLFLSPSRVPIKSPDRRKQKLKFNVTRSRYTRFQLDSRNCKGPTVAPISKVGPKSKVNVLPGRIGTKDLPLITIVTARCRIERFSSLSLTICKNEILVGTNRVLPLAMSQPLTAQSTPRSTTHWQQSLRDTCRFLLDFSPS